MKNIRVASRYAKSLIDLAQEQGLVDQVHADMAHLLAIIKEERDFRVFLASPLIREKKKTEVFQALFGGHFQALTLLFINLLVKQSREGELNLIAEDYIRQYHVLKGIVVAEVTTAVGMSEEQRNRITAVIKKVSGKPIVVLSETVKPEILGGLQLRVGDREYNGSLHEKLVKLHHQFDQNLYEPDYN
jgi:F-type H+-transporting ATPase subunit delta